MQSAMAALLKDMNELSGLFLLLIAICAGSCVSLLSVIKSELECLQDDFNAVHDTHRRWEP
jgi:hypothetical protein